MNLTRQAGATLAAVALVLATAGVAAASTGSSTPARPVADTTQQKPKAQAAKRLLTDEQRAQLRSKGHLEIVKQTPRRGAVTILVQRGEVTAVSATSISLKSKDGFTHSYTIVAKTKIREQRAPINISELKVGERAMVIARRTDAGDIAQRVGCLSERTGAKKAKVAKAGTRTAA